MNTRQRPETPTDPLTPLNVTVPFTLYLAVDAYAKGRHMSKAAAVRVLLTAGLAALPDGQLPGQTVIGGGE
jgi:hypothetical protein